MQSAVSAYSRGTGKGGGELVFAPRLTVSARFNDLSSKCLPLLTANHDLR